MHFVFYPTHEFACPYISHCPHLGGAALSTLVSAADQQIEWTDALHRQIDDLRANNTAKFHKIEELTARIEQLERELKAERQKQFKSKKKEPGPDVSPEGTEGSAEATPPEGRKKRGAPAGHPGTRSGAVSRMILGDDYCGGLHMDCYAGYDRHKTQIKQRCLAHLKRTAVTWCKLLPKEAGDSRAFFAAVTQWVKRGCAWHRKWKNSSGPEKDQEAEWLRQELERLQQMPTDSEHAARLQKRLRRYRREWLTFLDHAGVSPTNNLAEQALRAIVIVRKLTFGSRTRAGAKRLGTMMTVIETTKRQGQNVLKFLDGLFTMDTNEARRAMYARQ